MTASPRREIATTTRLRPDRCGVGWMGTSPVVVGAVRLFVGPRMRLNAWSSSSSSTRPDGEAVVRLPIRRDRFEMPAGFQVHAEVGSICA